MKVEEKELNISYDKLLVEFIREAYDKSIGVRPDGFGITVMEFAKLNGISKSPSAKILNSLVEEGKLSREKMIINSKVGSKPYVYFRPGTDPHSVSDGDE